MSSEVPKETPQSSSSVLYQNTKDSLSKILQKVSNSISTVYSKTLKKAPKPNDEQERPSSETKKQSKLIKNISQKGQQILNTSKKHTVKIYNVSKQYSYKIYEKSKQYSYIVYENGKDITKDVALYLMVNSDKIINKVIREVGKEGKNQNGVGIQTKVDRALQVIVDEIVYGLIALNFAKLGVSKIVSLIGFKGLGVLKGGLLSWGKTATAKAWLALMPSLTLKTLMTTYIPVVVPTVVLTYAGYRLYVNVVNKKSEDNQNGQQIKSARKIIQEQHPQFDIKSIQQYIQDSKKQKFPHYSHTTYTNSNSFTNHEYQKHDQKTL